MLNGKTSSGLGWFIHHESTLKYSNISSLQPSPSHGGRLEALGTGPGASGEVPECSD